jgi:hypothetical protein
MPGNLSTDGPVIWLQRSVPPVLDPYEGSERLPWWKGQLHTHTARSYDGDPKVPADRRASLYQDAGFDFLVYTDHNKITGAPRGAIRMPWGDTIAPDTSSVPVLEESARRPILFIPGIESTDPKGHLGAWFFGPDVTGVSDPPRVRAGQPPAERIKAWADAGALVACYHPSHPAAPLEAGSIEAWAAAGMPFHFLEIYNTLATTAPDRLEYNLESWRRAVNAAGPDRPVWAIAADDSHRERVGQGWILAAAPALTAPALKEALLSGRLYASNGPQFTTIGVDGESGGVAVKAPGAEVLRFVGDDGNVRQWVRCESGLYVPPSKGDKERWVRVEALDSAGRTAWSQPFWIAAQSLLSNFDR